MHMCKARMVPSSNTSKHHANTSRCPPLQANEIEKARIIDHKRPGVGAMGGMAGGGYSPALGGSRAAAVDMDVGPSLQMPALGGFGAASGAAAAGRPGGIGVPKKGMQLGKAKGASSMLESLAKEEGVANLDAPVVPRAGAGPGPGPMVISGVWR